MQKHNRKHRTLENKVFSLIREDDQNSFLANVVDGTLMVLILASVLVAFMNTFDLSPELQSILSGLEIVFVVLFTVEYVLRLWTAELMYEGMSSFMSRLRYAFTPMALIDLFSILPFYLPLFGISVSVLKIFKLVRLLRIFKINRYTSSLSLIGEVLRTRATQLISSMIVILVLMFIASMMMYDIEHIAQPEVFDNALSAMWWAMATITTVGYGDIYPITTLGRILSTVITFLGIGLTAIPTGIISAGFIEHSRSKGIRKKETLSEHVICEACGQLVSEDSQMVKSP